MIYLSDRITSKGLRSGLIGVVLTMLMLALVSAPAYAGKDCSGAFTVTLSDGRTFSGKQTISIPVGSGLTAQVSGKFVNFTVNLDTFKMTNYILNSEITANRPSVIFARKEPLHGKTLTGSLSLDSNGEQLVLQRSGPGISMKIQAKDCSEGGIFQMEPDQTIEVEHELGAGFAYCVDSLNRVLIVGAGNPFIGRESPETASLSAPSPLSSIVGTRLSRWLIQGGGRMGMVTGEDAVEPLPPGTAPCSASPNPTPTPTASPTPSPSPSPSPSPGDERYVARFSSASYSVAENAGSVQITITRSGDTSRASKVDYTSTSGTASDRSDFTIARGRLFFAAGETSKSFSLLVTDDALAEGNETLNVIIIEASQSGSIGTPGAAVVTIVDDDTVTSGFNPIDDNRFFIRQHYLDFLNREPEPPGLEGWSRILENCANDDSRCDRTEVSSAFFRSAEFQERGYFIYRFYEVAFGRRPRFDEFTPDMARLNGAQTPAEQEANKVAFITEFMARPEFRARYDGLTSPTAYVDALLQNVRVTLPQRNGLINDLAEGRKTRAEVLREIVESAEVYTSVYNRGFVAMEYFGYLRRDPDEAGYTHWVNYLNATGDYRTLVYGFVHSIENRHRFGR